MNQINKPKVFVSHASEDKDRFVTQFAMKLRENGIDAWLDRWEMLPGDSLVDKIFEEGLKYAQAVIVVLSSMSVSKRWVREELNAALVKRISQNSKLIPIIIDDCEVPECLKSTVWVKIKDTQSYHEELKRIILAIYGKTDKPQMGEGPQYTREIATPIGTLTQLDSLIFCECCKRALLKNYSSLAAEELLTIGQGLEIAKSDMLDSVEVLAHRGYVKTLYSSGANVPRITITSYGFGEYLHSTRPDYAQLIRDVAFKIVNDQFKSGEELCSAINEPPIVLKQVVTSLEDQGLIEVVRFIGGLCAFRIIKVSPELKRWLSGQ